MARPGVRSSTDTAGVCVSDEMNTIFMNSRNSKNRKPYSPELQDICRIGGKQKEAGTPPKSAKRKSEEDDSCGGG